MKRPESPTSALAASPIPEPVLGIVETLGRLGHPSYLVGGCVRSLLRGEATVDYDVATAASPEAVLDAFARAIPTGLQHGTVMIPTEVGPVDVTAFRAGPKLEDDLAHRDFTINAMAYAPGEDALVDPFGGAADLEQRRLRAVGSARDRFAEDPLRALRAARLAATLDLQVDPSASAMPISMPGPGGWPRACVRPGWRRGRRWRRCCSIRRRCSRPITGRRWRARC